MLILFEIFIKLTVAIWFLSPRCVCFVWGVLNPLDHALHFSVLGIQVCFMGWNCKCFCPNILVSLFGDGIFIQLERT